jgi:polysaccharide biosynthesis transport protein
MTDEMLQQANDQSPHRSVACRWPWLLSLVIGLACAAVAGLAVWFGIGERYTASAYLRVDIQVVMVMGAQPNVFDRAQFEIFKRTQQQMVVGRLVLLRALGKPEVSKISAVKEEQGTGRDPVDWLARQVSVSFPGKAEVMEVSVTRKDAHEAAVLVNAIVDSYLNDVVSRTSPVVGSSVKSCHIWCLRGSGVS